MNATHGAILERLGIELRTMWGWGILSDEVETYAASLEAIAEAVEAVDVDGLDQGGETVADAFESFHDALSAQGLVLEWPTLAEVFAAAHGMDHGQEFGTGLGALAGAADSHPVAVGMDPLEATAGTWWEFEDGSGIVVVGDTWDLHPGGEYRVREFDSLDDLARSASPPWYTIRRGSYYGTNDDNAERWYVERADADMVDRRSRGHATISDALAAADEATADALPDRLRSWREAANLSQADAAVRLGVSLRTLHGWESGGPPVSAVLVAWAIEGIRQHRKGDRGP